VRWAAAESGDNDNTVIFLRNASAFRRRLAAAKVVRIELSFFREGSHVFEFPVTAFEPKRLADTSL